MEISQVSCHDSARQQTDRAFRDLNVALLEDDKVEADLLSSLLKEGWSGRVETEVFRRVEDLVTWLAHSHPDVVFCDLSVPDGQSQSQSQGLNQSLSVVQQVVAAAGHTPIVVLTSQTDPDLSTHALSCGAQDYLTKGSFDGELLARTLRYAMAKAAAERKNRKISQNLGQLHRDLDRYAGIMANDLRAPVRTARLFTDRLVTLTRAGDDPTTVARALESSLERLELMIARLQIIASLRDRMLERSEEPLAKIVADVTAELSQEAETANFLIECEHEEPIAADPTLIRDMFRELMRNSINYRDPDPDADLAITIGLDQQPYASIITVADNGIGIHPDHRERVFRLFECLNGAGPTGLGFGLAFCTQVAEIHGGSIEAVQPLNGVGTCIRIELPRLCADRW